MSPSLIVDASNQRALNVTINGGGRKYKAVVYGGLEVESTLERRYRIT